MGPGGGFHLGPWGLYLAASESQFELPRRAPLTDSGGRPRRRVQFGVEAPRAEATGPRLNVGSAPLRVPGGLLAAAPLEAPGAGGEGLWGAVVPRGAR